MDDLKLSILAANYQSHQWKWHRTSDQHNGVEYFGVCEVCGLQDCGDPVEMSILDFPHCDDIPRD